MEARRTQRKESFSGCTRHIRHLNGGGLSASLAGDITVDSCVSLASTGDICPIPLA